MLIYVTGKDSCSIIDKSGLVCYSRIPLFRTRLIRSPLYFEQRSNSLEFTFRFSVIYYQLFRTRLFRIPCYLELIVLPLQPPLFRTCQKRSTYIRAQMDFIRACVINECLTHVQCPAKKFDYKLTKHTVTGDSVKSGCGRGTIIK